MIRVERKAMVWVVCEAVGRSGQRSVTGFPVPRYSWPSHGSTSPVMPRKCPAQAAQVRMESAHSGWSRRPDWPLPVTSCSPDGTVGTRVPPPYFSRLFFDLICCKGNLHRKFDLCLSFKGRESSKLESNWNWKLDIFSWRLPKKL